MEESNVMEFCKAAKKNYDIKMNCESKNEFNSSIVELQGMTIEMFATPENLEELCSSLFINPKMFDYSIDEKNVQKVEALIEYKQKENENSIRLAA